MRTPIARIPGGEGWASNGNENGNKSQGWRKVTRGREERNMMFEDGVSAYAPHTIDKQKEERKE